MQTLTCSFHVFSMIQELILRLIYSSAKDAGGKCLFISCRQSYVYLRWYANCSFPAICSLLSTFLSSPHQVLPSRKISHKDSIPRIFYMYFLQCILFIYIDTQICVCVIHAFPFQVYLFLNICNIWL